MAALALGTSKKSKWARKPEMRWGSRRTTDSTGMDESRRGSSEHGTLGTGHCARNSGARDTGTTGALNTGTAGARETDRTRWGLGVGRKGQGGDQEAKQSRADKYRQQKVEKAGARSTGASSSSGDTPRGRREQGMKGEEEKEAPGLGAERGRSREH